MPELDMNAEILKALKKLGKPAKSKEIAEVIGVPSSKVSCRMSPLAKKGLVQKVDKGLYALTPEGEKQV